jgi:hypothetical protein
MLKSYENGISVILLCGTYVCIRMLEREFYNTINKNEKTEHTSIFVNVFIMTVSTLFLLNYMSYATTTYLVNMLPQIFYMENALTRFLGETGCAIINSIDIILFVLTYVQIISIKPKILKIKDEKVILKPKFNSKILDVIILAVGIIYPIILIRG